MMEASKEAKHLVTYGFVGNGCGNSRSTTLLAAVLQWWARVDFCEACRYHDAERACETKTEHHRLDSDKDFMLNLETCCYRLKVKKYRQRSLRVAKWFHWAVVLKSKDTYYNNKVRRK